MWHFLVVALTPTGRGPQVRDTIENDIYDCVEAEGTYERHVKIPVSFPQFKVNVLPRPPPHPIDGVEEREMISLEGMRSGDRCDGAFGR